MLSVFTGSLARLATFAQRRIDTAFATSTARAYYAKFRLFVAFLSFHQLSIYQVDVFLLLAFFKFLHLNSFKVSNILNHSSAIKSKFALLGLNVAPFDNHRIHCFFKALQKHSPLTVRMKSIIDTQLLEQICNTCDRTFQGHVFKVAYLLGFLPS